MEHNSLQVYVRAWARRGPQFRPPVHRYRDGAKERGWEREREKRDREKERGQREREREKERERESRDQSSYISCIIAPVPC